LSNEADRRPASEHSSPELGFTLEDLDRDSAIIEGIAAVYGESRAAFLRKAVFGGAALLAGLAAVPADAAGGKNKDVATLNFDLVFEYLQSSFYLGAVREGTVAAMRPKKERWARVLGAHEIAHVEILKSVLGRQAVAKPFFNFRGVTESESAFTRTAVAMEDLTVALLAGQAPHFRDRKLVSAAFSLLTTEARHAAWARRIAGIVPVANAFDEPKTLPEVNRVVRSTRFLAARPRTQSRRRPRLTG
jgi:ferritin-like protein